MALVAHTETMTVFRGVVANSTPTVASELGHSLPTAISQQQKIVMTMYYWVYEVKCKRVMLFESLTSWDTIVNYTNYFCQECCQWLLTTNQLLAGLDAKASLFSWRWMKPTFSIENITVASDVLVSGLSAWLSVVVADVDWRLLPVEMHQHWSESSQIMCCQGQQSSRTLGEDIKMLLSSTTGCMITLSLCTLMSLLIQ